MEKFFRHFKEFAGFVLTGQALLSEMARQNLIVARANGISLPEFHGSLSEPEVLLAGQKSLADFLRDVLHDISLEEAFSAIDRGRENELRGIPHSGVSVSDIVLLYSIRKQVFLHFLPKFTQDIDLFSKIVLELEVYHQKVEKYAFETFAEIREEAFTKKKELTEIILNNSIEGIMAFDKEERFVLWNKSLEQRQGIKKEEVLGKKFFEVFPDLEGTESGDSLQKAFQGEAVYIKEKPDLSGYGWFDASMIPLPDKSGNVFGAVGMVHNLASRKEKQPAPEKQTEELSAGRREAGEKQKSINEAIEQLREQQHFIRAVTESVPEMIFIYDLIEDKNIYSNNEITRVLGYSPEEFKAFGKGLLKKNTHPDDLKIVEQRNREYRNMKEGEIADVTFRYRNSKDEYRHIRTKSRIYRFTPDGRPWQVLGVTEDVTEKVKKEEELKRSRDYYLTILDDFPSLIWRSDTEGLCDYFNKAWLEFTGRTFEQEYGNGWAEGVHPDDFNLCQKTYLTNFKARSPFQMECRMRRHDGSYRWIIDYAKPIYDVEGNFTGFLGACFDIQDRKDFEHKIRSTNEELSVTLDELQKAQEHLMDANSRLEQRVAQRTEQLEAGEKQLRLLTDALPVLISFVDSNGIYRFVNRTYSLWFGKTKEELEGTHFKEVIGETAYNAMKTYVQSVQQGKEVRVEKTMDYRYGGTRNVSLNLIPYLENQEVKGFYSLVYDISEIRKAQQSLEDALSGISQKNTELIRINNDLDNFIYAASHDLKSPVINMEGILKLLEKAMAHKMEEKEEKLFSLMLTSVLKLKKTISYLTDVTRISKNIEEAKEIISIPSIVEEAVVNNQHLTDAVKPEIMEKYEVETIEFSRGNFYSIVVNLLTNAIKFRAAGRRLNINISTFTEGDFVIFQVKDNGLGLSAEKQLNTFKLFRRMHAHVEGSGVGLYIVKRITENCGGHVQVGGAEGEGAVFKIYFPISLTQSGKRKSLARGAAL